jgi:site-specific DNA-methyltransferase (adenine-specific)
MLDAKASSNSYMPTARSINWGTPTEIRERFSQHFDPCPFPRGSFDGLDIPWPNKVFVNPPFSALSEWAEKCAVEYQSGCSDIVLLLPSRTDTKYFHSFIMPFAEIEFLKGRLKFVDLDKSSRAPVSAPFPCILAHYGRKHG